MSSPSYLEMELVYKDIDWCGKIDSLHFHHDRKEMWFGGHWGGSGGTMWFGVKSLQDFESKCHELNASSAIIEAGITYWNNLHDFS